jgi:hypothetical protein
LFLSGEEKANWTTYSNQMTSSMYNIYSKTHFFFIIIRIYSSFRGDSLWQLWIALHCTLVRLPPPPPFPTLSPTHLKQLQEVSSFYFLYVYGAHQPHSLTFISSHNCTYFTVLSFIINSKVNVQLSVECIKLNEESYVVGITRCPWCL